MSEQIAIRIPDAVAASLDELVSTGRFETKAEAVRTALERLIDAERRRRIGDSIVQGYRRVPQARGDELDDLTQAATSQTLRALDAEERTEGLSW